MGETASEQVIAGRAVSRIVDQICKDISSVPMNLFEMQLVLVAAHRRMQLAIGRTEVMVNELESELGFAQSFLDSLHTGGDINTFVPSVVGVSANRSSVSLTTPITEKKNKEEDSEYRRSMQGIRTRRLEDSYKEVASSHPGDTIKKQDHV